MKRITLLLALLIASSSLTYASFPVQQDSDLPITEITNSINDNENIAPIVSSSSNWQGIVSLSCLIVGLVLSWPFLIPGLVFGILGIIGDKERKWMGWVGMIANAVYLLLVLAVIGATV